MDTIITLTTDFGTCDGYVGAMKGVILSLIPSAHLVDISHAIPAQDVQQGAFVLYTAFRYFPPHTVHLAVVDPGVGGARRILAARCGGHRFVAPDNGLLGYVFSEEPPEQVVALTNRSFWRDAVSNTFHGRDIMAPAAAHLALGVPLTDMGEAIEDWVGLDWPHPHRQPDGSIVGQVLSVDHFGNLVTNIPAHMLAERPLWRITIGSLHLIGPSSTYATVPIGRPLALVGSHDHLEIAVRQGSAAQKAEAGSGETVVLLPG